MAAHGILRNGVSYGSPFDCTLWATATETKEDKVRVAFATLGATPPKGALVYAS